jgi:hypothetical protein
VRLGVGVGLAALAAVAILAFVFRDPGSGPGPVATVAPQPPANAAGRRPEPPIAERPDTGRQSVPSATVVAAGSWQDLLEMSSNYLEFVDRALPAARGGDASAQFALYQALEYCQDGYRGYFDRPGKRRTLDEALNWASTRSVNMDAVRDVHRRCEALMARGTGELGSSRSWLEKASEAGIPAAQTRKALDELRAAYLQSVPWPDRTALTATEFDERKAGARALVLEAVAAADPGATWDAADAIFYLTGSGSTADTEQWVWKMAACIQGYDCGPGATWVAAFCHYETVNPCSGGESGTEVIRQAWVQASGRSDTSDLDERAQQLADRLNSGQFSDEDLTEFMKAGRTP